jgi:hypothetical protein
VSVILRRDVKATAIGSLPRTPGAALDRDGVVALLNARSSVKRAGQIGRFGIGFKSL